MGGYNGRVRMSSAERYDPERNQWEMVASMNKQRSDASAASLNNKVNFFFFFFDYILFNQVYKNIYIIIFRCT